MLKTLPIRRTRTDVKHRDGFRKEWRNPRTRREWPLVTMCCQSHWRGDLLWNSRWVRWRRKRECQPSLPKSDIAVTWHGMWQDKTVQDTTRRRIPSTPRCHGTLRVYWAWLGHWPYKASVNNTSKSLAFIYGVTDKAGFVIECKSGSETVRYYFCIFKTTLRLILSCSTAVGRINVVYKYKFTFMAYLSTLFVTPIKKDGRFFFACKCWNIREM
jgi:hypothetical protein